MIIPFKVGEEVPNTVTPAAFAEGNKMSHGPNAPRFSSVQALFEDLDNA